LKNSVFFHLPEGILLTIKDDEGKIVGCGGVKPFQNSTGIIKRFYIIPQLQEKVLQEPNQLWRESLAPDKFFYYKLAI